MPGRASWTLGALALVGTIVAGSALAGCSLGASEASTTTATSSTAVPTGDVPDAADATAPAPSTTTGETTSSAPKVVFTKTVGPGAKGDEVAYVQQRLKDLGFDPGPVDGAYGTATQQAVWAYQALVLGASGKAKTGVVTPDLWSRMQDPLGLQARLPDRGRRHVEVYLPEQALVLFDTNGVVRLVTHVSTGSGRDWCESGECGTAVTPPGSYRFTRRVSGWRQSDLGLLYNPVYFNQGIAVHGAPSVPNGPASHGCVRIPMHIADYFPDLVHNGDDVFVFDGTKSPLDWGQVPPPPNRPDPAATTTVPPTSAAPSTSQPSAPATSTTAPAPTTTGAPTPDTTAPPATSATSSTTPA